MPPGVALPPAHVLGGGTAGWADGLLLAEVAVAAGVAIAVRRPSVRRWAAACAALGVVAALALGAAFPGPPRSPGYQLLLAVPSGPTLTSPVALRLCAWYPSGLPAAVPGGNEVLSVSVDGVERLTVTASTAAVDVPGGTHTLGVEVLTGGHVVYSPRARVQRTVDVEGTGPLARPAACPSQPPTPTPRPSP